MVSAPDLTLPAGSGMVNIRVGAILMKGPQFLMAGNTGSDYLYSVGGRIKFGETAEEAVLREVYEETGYKLKVDRLGFIYENRFVCDWGSNSGKNTTRSVSFSIWQYRTVSILSAQAQLITGIRNSSAGSARVTL